MNMGVESPMHGACACEFGKTTESYKGKAFAMNMVHALALEQNDPSPVISNSCWKGMSMRNYYLANIHTMSVEELSALSNSLGAFAADVEILQKIVSRWEKIFQEVPVKIVHHTKIVYREEPLEMGQ